MKPCDNLRGACDNYPACVCGRATRAEETKRAAPPASDARAALAELVAIKELKVLAARGPNDKPRKKWTDADYVWYGNLSGEIARREPLAWAAARAILATSAGTIQESIALAALAPVSSAGTPPSAEADARELWHRATLRAEAAERVLRHIVQVYDARSELFTNDADCAATLTDHARAHLSTVATPGDKP